MLGALIDEIRYAKGARGARRWALVALALTSASCVPVSVAQPPASLSEAPAAPAPVMAAAPAVPIMAAALPDSLPAGSTRLAFQGRT